MKVYCVFNTYIYYCYFLVSATVSSASQSHYEQEESQTYDALDVESDNDLDGELDLDDDDIPVSFKNALILNEVRKFIIVHNLEHTVFPHIVSSLE